MLSAEAEGVTLAIMDHYQNQQGPFEDVESSILPVESVMNDMKFHGDRDRATYLTLSTALNFMRSAETLRRKTKALWEQEQWIYDPADLVGNDRYGELLELFTTPISYTDGQGNEEEGKMRMGKRDTDIWFTIAAGLSEEHDGNPIDLFQVQDFDANAIFEYMEEQSRDDYAHVRITWSKKKYPYLGGEKIGPLWLRLVHDLVPSVELKGVDLLPLPVDRQIVKVTNHLEGTEYSLEPSAQKRREIRDLWHPFCEEHGVSTAELDDALWRIGEQGDDEKGNWERWGKEYLEDPENWSGTS